MKLTKSSLVIGSIFSRLVRWIKFRDSIHLSYLLIESHPINKVLLICESKFITC